MEQIGFKNFRKFAEFPAIDLSPISVMVGENNAGKSTVIKGILALSDFLNENYLLAVSGDNAKKKKKAIVDVLKNKKFYFNTSYLAHIGTFKRAIYNNAADNTINFFMRSGHRDLTIEVTGDRESDEIVSGIISKICLDYRFAGIHIEFNLQKDLATVTFDKVDVQEDQLDFLPKDKRSDAKEFLASIPHPYFFKYHISDYCRNFQTDFIYLLEASVEIAICATIEYDKTVKHIGPRMINDLKSVPRVDDETIEFLKIFTNIVCPNYDAARWMFLLPETSYDSRFVIIEYIYAHAVSQSVVYSAKDSNDYLSRTVHEFASIPPSKDDYRRKFITHWMDVFKIGKNYEITSVGGEAHLVKIINNDGKSVNLADKGMGSIQLMVLLFRLAINLPRPISSKGKSISKSIMNSNASRIIIIEEPEQNLHPTLQSKLADLFYELNRDYGFRFIVETHSEYLIRKIQVLVSNMNNGKDEKTIIDNPFKIYYVPSVGVPYEMIFRPDGAFQNEFGEGFFDEATNLAFEIL